MNAYASAVIYGTSDWYLNCAEVLLTHLVFDLVSDLVAEETNFGMYFFYYPKGPEWLYWEKMLFDPHYPPVNLDPKLQAGEAGFHNRIRFHTLQELVDELGNDISTLTINDIVELIRRHRNRKYWSFVVANVIRNGSIVRVRASSKDSMYTEHYKNLRLPLLIQDPKVKLGGSLIYFLYGAFLNKNQHIIGILPKKINGDVIGAFRAGENLIGTSANIIETGEIDLMTSLQWKKYMYDGCWRKVNPWVVRRLMEKNPEFLEVLKKRLLEEKKWAPVCYDIDGDKFFFWGEEE